MNFDNIGMGVDIEEISRFKNKTLETSADFLSKVYTKNEIDYCFKRRNFAQHLCARFCAKEAIIKALFSLNIKDISYKQIEITNRDDGCPIVNILNHTNVYAKISMSHSKNNAIASAIVFLK